MSQHDIVPVDRYTDADLSEFHRWRIDELGSHKHYSELGGDPVDEILQNAFDSNDKGVPNNISVLLDKSGDPKQPFLTVIDEGRHGICKDYDGDINEFLAAKKATTEKTKRDLQRKGLGMFSYPNLGSPVIITSMDNDFIHRIPVFRDKEGWNGFGKTVTKPNKDTYPREFQIYNNGTRVAVFNKHPQVEPLTAQTLRKTISERFAFKLYDNPKVHVYVDGKEVTMPSWIVDHPPQVMGLSSDHNPYHDIRGHIWEAPDGNGRINVYQDGYLVEALQIDARKVKGYLEYNRPPTNPERTGFPPSPELSELKQWLKEQLSVFPKVDAPCIDKKEKDAAIDVAMHVLGNYLKNFTYPGGTPQVTKSITTTTDPTGNDVIGYTFNPEPPQPQGGGTPKGTINVDNVTKVGTGLGVEHGGKLVKIQDEKTQGPRRQTRPLDYTEQDVSPNSPLWILQKGTGTRGMPLLIVNRLNAEYPMYKMMPGGMTKLIMMAMWMSEISMNEASPTRNGLPDHYRMKHSRFRVDAWNSMNLFPKPVSDKSLCNPRNKRYL